MTNKQVSVGERLNIVIHDMFYIGHIDEKAQFVIDFEAKIKKRESLD